jgi:copper resistance protein B
LKALTCAGALIAAAPAYAQGMPGMDMSGHAHHQAAPASAKPPAAQPSAPTVPEMGMSGHQHGKAAQPAAEPAAAAPPGDAPGHTAPAEPAGTDLSPPETSPPAPPPPADRAADAVWGAAAMAPAREQMHHEHGGMRLHQILFNLAEVQVRRGREDYRWDGEGWWGGDIDRLVVKSEGEAAFGRRLEAAEVQLLYSRAIGPYYDLQAGVRQDLGAGVRRTYASIGLEGLAPYWFETEGTLFLSDKGDVLARGEAWYDQRITQRLILQPRMELNFAAQNVPEQRIGRGLSTAELGFRLRYEIRREFAPYLGVSWERKVGRTGDYARADGEGRGGAAAVFGVRAWF